MEQLYPVRRAVSDPLTIYDDIELPEGCGDKPFVAVNMVTTVDGKITLNKKERAEPIGSQVDRELMKRIRVHFDAVVRGAETVRANPYFPGVPEPMADRRERHGKSRQPLGVIVSGSLDLPFASPYFDAAVPVILTTASSDPRKREEASRRAHVEIAGEDELDPVRALEILYAKYGVRRLLVEGGAALNYTFAQRGALDLLFWTLAPKISGYREDLTMIAGPALITPVPKLELETLYFHEQEFYFCWRFARSPRAGEGL